MNLVVYCKVDICYDFDNDIMLLCIVNVNFYNGVYNFFEELQIIGFDMGVLKWIVGGYYFNLVG